MANFETFRRSLVPLRSKPAVTIHVRGTVSLNASAVAALGSPAAVELLYDKVLRIVGFRATDPKKDTAHALRPTADGTGPSVVSALTFLRFHDLQPAVSRRWEAYLDDGVLCVDLRLPGVPVTSNRAGSADRDK